MNMASVSGAVCAPVRALFPDVGFPTALAPMQDVTGLPFMSLIAEYGAPDLFFTEYFRVHENARVDPEIVESGTGLFWGIAARQSSTGGRFTGTCGAVASNRMSACIR